MHDGRFYTLQHQVSDVIQNDKEMAGKEKEVLAKVLSCKTYKKAFDKLLPYTYTETEVGFQHVVSALTHYIGRFSYYSSPFDQAMEGKSNISPQVKKGFNLFMGKAQCGTCHFVPQFNGVKPPFTNSEFEVLGTPESTDYKAISPDSGRAAFFYAPETQHAFRTGTVRNSSRTSPYMHNGVFKTMEELMAFYNAGGGKGKGLLVPNQTLPEDSLHLSKTEIKNLVAFMKSLDEEVNIPKPPLKLPLSSNVYLNRRKVGGLY
jgi:cytochrome c peroxidase